MKAIVQIDTKRVCLYPTNMKRILISNDDGIDSPGIEILREKLAQIGQVTVVAPDRERSTVSHALSLQRPLRISEIKKNIYAVDGTPSDCVNIALSHIMLSNPPDIVVSGINNGANLGDDIIYSGTVAAAMEAVLSDVPAIAISLVGDHKNIKEYEQSANFALRITKYALKNPIPKGILLNVNVPSYYKGKDCYKFTRTGRRYYTKELLQREDPRGSKYYWIGGKIQKDDTTEGTDCMEINDGNVTITPVKIDFTDYQFLERSATLKL